MNKQIYRFILALILAVNSQAVAGMQLNKTKYEEIRKILLEKQERAHKLRNDYLEAILNANFSGAEDIKEELDRLEENINKLNQDMLNLIRSLPVKLKKQSPR